MSRARIKNKVNRVRDLNDADIVSTVAKFEAPGMVWDKSDCERLGEMLGCWRSPIDRQKLDDRLGLDSLECRVLRLVHEGKLSESEGAVRAV